MGKGENKYTKTLLIDELRYRTGTNKGDVKELINAFLGLMEEKFKEEGEHSVVFYDFGKFRKVKKKGGNYVSPDGEEGEYGPFYDITFTPSKRIRRDLRKQAREE